MSCPVCLLEFKKLVSTPCGHEFCKKCISKCLESNESCPLCRTRVSKDFFSEYKRKGRASTRLHARNARKEASDFMLFYIISGRSISKTELKYLFNLVYENHACFHPTTRENNTRFLNGFNRIVIEASEFYKDKDLLKYVLQYRGNRFLYEYI